MYLLTWIYGGTAREIYRSPSVQLVQAKRSAMKKEQQYKKGRFEIRTEEGFKAKPILKA